RHLGSFDVGREVPQVGARPPVLFTGDLACGDLVEQSDGTVGDARDALLVERRLEVGGVHVVVERLDVRDELVSIRRTLGGRGRRGRPPGGGATPWGRWRAARRPWGGAGAGGRCSGPPRRWGGLLRGGGRPRPPLARPSRCGG